MHKKDKKRLDCELESEVYRHGHLCPDDVSGEGSEPVMRGKLEVT